ncbi:Pkinase-domain-containing protein [Hymenopellis radicata]|nr:Pkinase-domain-containing protein [Hymenopellis radicata]
MPEKVTDPAVIAPCQYRTGKTLGSGTYAIVKEAIHIETRERFACKVINKRLMKGREHLVRNEVNILKKISTGHKNIVSLRDYFETEYNLYLVFELCTGGELFDRICKKGCYYEYDAVDIVRSVVDAVKYIHAAGIVHRDLKPENLLFRNPGDDADVMITDFGLSFILDECKAVKVTEICGTVAYMAPEIFKKTGHGQPVDIWAIGVITYFLLAGYTPFGRETQKEEIQAIKRGDFKFEPKGYWKSISPTAEDFIRQCLKLDPAERPTAAEALEHKWLAPKSSRSCDRPHSPKDLLPFVQSASANARNLWRRAAVSIATHLSSATLKPDNTEDQRLFDDVRKCQKESHEEDMETRLSRIKNFSKAMSIRS